MSAFGIQLALVAAVGFAETPVSSSDEDTYPCSGCYKRHFLSVPSSVASSSYRCVSYLNIRRWTVNTGPVSLSSKRPQTSHYTVKHIISIALPGFNHELKEAWCRATLRDATSVFKLARPHRCRGNRARDLIRVRHLFKVEWPVKATIHLAEGFVNLKCWYDSRSMWTKMCEDPWSEW